MSDTQSTEISARPSSKFTAEHAHEVGLPSPEAVNFMMSIANMLLTSALITPDMEPSKDAIQALVAAKWEPKEIDDYRDKVIKSNAMAKMLVGREMNMEAMESLQDVDIVKGKIFIRYPQLIGQMIRKGFVVKWIERSNERAALEVTRPDLEPQLFEFTIEDARRAGLLGGKPEYNQYLLRPRVMLTARCASEAYRTTGGRSNTYTPEEKAEILNSDSTMGEATDADRQRVDAMVAQNQFHVGLKAKPEAAADANKAPVVTDPPQTTTPAPTTTASAAPAPSQTPASAPQNTQTVTFEIHSLRQDGSVEKMESEDVQTKQEMAELRASTLYAQTPGVYFVMKRTANSDGNAGSLTQVSQTDNPAAASKPTPTTTAPPVTAVPVSELRQRLAVVSKLVEEAVNRGVEPKHVTPEKTVVARVKTFLQGYFAVSKLADLPKDIAAYTDAFADLESCAARDVNALFAAPEDTGKRMAADSRNWAEYFKGLIWPAETQEKARTLARLRGMPAVDFKLFASSIGLDRMKDPKDVYASLRLCMASRNGGKFIRECESRNLSPRESVEIIEFRKCDGKLDEADTKTVDAAIDWALEAINNAAESKAPAPPAKPVAAPAVAPAVVVEDDGDDLFGQLP